MAHCSPSWHQAPYEEAPADFKEELWPGEDESHQATNETVHGGPGSERSGHRKRRRRRFQRRGRQDYDNEQLEQPEQPEQSEQQQEQQYAYNQQYPPQQYSPLSQYSPPQPYGWSIPQQQPYTQHAVPQPLHPLNYMSTSMRYSESSQYAGYGPAPSPYGPYPIRYAQGPPTIQHPPLYAPAPSPYVQPIIPVSTQPSQASYTYKGWPLGVRKSKKGPPQVQNPPGAKKRRKRLETINNCLAKGKRELDDLENQVSALKTWYKGLEGMKASLKEEEEVEHDGERVKVEEMEDEVIYFGDEEEEGDDGGVRVDGEWHEAEEKYGEQQEVSITLWPIKREL